MTSFADFAFEQLQRHGNKTFIIDVGTGRQMTFLQVLRESRLLTRWLRSRLLLSSQTVCLCSRSRAEYLTTFLAVSAAGGVVCQINPEFTYGEMRQAFDRVSPVIVFCELDNIQVVRQAADEHQQIVVFSDMFDPNIDGTLTYSSVIQEGASGLKSDDHFDCRPVHLFPDSPLHILFSSGTTGLPKPVVVSHQARIINSYQLSDPTVKLFQSEDVVLLILPLYLMFATVLWSVALLEGATIVLLPRFRPETFLDAIQEHRVTVLPTAPPLVLFLLTCPLVNKFDISSLRNVVCGGAPLPPSLGEALKKKLNLKSCKQGYGLTEAGHLTLPPNRTADGDREPVICGRQECHSIGRPLPGIEFQVRDLSSGRPLGTHQRGQLCFRGPQIMSGYLDNPQATADMIDADGWLLTGDVGYEDDDGYIYYVDRVKDLIKCKGHQVSPAELEDLLLRHPAVMDAAVLGLPDLYAGELPFAFIVPRNDLPELPREGDILAFVAERTCRQKHLTGGLRFVESIPRTASGKILRRTLRDLLLTGADKIPVL